MRRGNGSRRSRGDNGVSNLSRSLLGFLSDDSRSTHLESLQLSPVSHCEALGSIDTVIIKRGKKTHETLSQKELEKLA